MDDFENETQMERQRVSYLQIICGEGMIKLQNCMLKNRDFKMCKAGHFHFAKNRTFLLHFDKFV